MPQVLIDFRKTFDCAIPLLSTADHGVHVIPILNHLDEFLQHVNLTFLDLTSRFFLRLTQGMPRMPVIVRLTEKFPALDFVIDHARSPTKVRSLDIFRKLSSLLYR